MSMSSHLNQVLPLPTPQHPSYEVLDASKLNTFMECPRKFFYSYLLAWRSEVPNNHLVFGSAWHKAMEHLLLHGYNADTVLGAFAAFEKEYRKTFTEPATDEMFWPKNPDRAFEALIAYTREHQGDEVKFQPLYTEIAFSVSLDPERVMHGRMDSIVRLVETGKIASLEHKTASSANRWGEQWPLSMQGSLYTHALCCLYGYDELHGIIFNGTVFKKVKGTRGGEKFEFVRETVKRSKNGMQAWHANTLYWHQAVENEYELLSLTTDKHETMTAFPMNTTACSNYFGCQFKEFCLAWKNPLQRCAEPPLGLKIERWNPLDEPASVKMELTPGAQPSITTQTEAQDDDNSEGSNSFVSS